MNNRAIRSFTPQISDACIADLLTRLKATRFPDAETVEDWGQGLPLSYQQELIDYWRADYGYRGDWQPEQVQLLVPKKKAANMNGPRLLHAVQHERNIVSEIAAKLVAIKPARPPEQSQQRPPEIKVHLV